MPPQTLTVDVVVLDVGEIDRLVDLLIRVVPTYGLCISLVVYDGRITKAEGRDLLILLLADPSGYPSAFRPGRVPFAHQPRCNRGS